MSTALSLYVTYPTREALLDAWSGEDHSTTEVKQTGSWQYLYFKGVCLYSLQSGRRQLVAVRMQRSDNSNLLVVFAAKVNTKYNLAPETAFHWWKTRGGYESAIDVPFTEHDFIINGRTMTTARHTVRRWVKHFQTQAKRNYKAFTGARRRGRWHDAESYASSFLYSSISSAEDLARFLGSDPFDFSDALGVPHDHAAMDARNYIALYEKTSEAL